MKPFGQIVLLAAALMFLGFGVIFLVRPASAGRAAGYEPVGTKGVIELRAFYGGMEVGLGLFLVAAMVRGAWRQAGLVLVALLTGGTAIGRAIGFVLDGDVPAIHWLYVVVEAAFAVAAVAAWRGGRRVRSTQPAR